MASLGHHLSRGATRCRSAAAQGKQYAAFVRLSAWSATTGVEPAAQEQKDQQAQHGQAEPECQLLLSPS